MKKLTIFLITCLLILCSCAFSDDSLDNQEDPIKAFRPVAFSSYDVYVGMLHKDLYSMLSATSNKDTLLNFHDVGQLGFFQDRYGLSVIVFYDSDVRLDENRRIVKIERYAQPIHYPSKEEFNLKSRETTFSEFVKYFGLPRIFPEISGCPLIFVGNEEWGGAQMFIEKDGTVFFLNSIYN